MPRRPRIAIPVPTSFDPAYNAQSWPEYAAAVERSGGEAVRLEFTAAQALPGYLDGVLLPGSGADVSPERYGHLSAPETTPPDPRREELDRLLLELVEKDGVPLLGICFGLQSLNVHRGGTLVQHLPPMPVNHRAGRPVLEAHAAVLTENSRLGVLAMAADSDQGLRCMVNSSHHQAVAAPGSSLRVIAQSPEDGVIEAVEDTSHPWLLAVQWHPERTFDRSVLSRAIFADFVAAALARQR